MDMTYGNKQKRVKDIQASNHEDNTKRSSM